MADVDKYNVDLEKIPKIDSFEVKLNNQNGKFKYKEIAKFKSYSEIKYLIYDKKTLYPSLLVDYKESILRLMTMLNYDRQGHQLYLYPNRSLNKITAKEEMFILEYKILDNNFVEIENYFIKPIAYSKYNKV